MKDRRSQDPPTPLREDHGIFKTGVVEVRLDLAPMSRTASRGDLVCIGHIADAEVEVVFPGRRQSETGPLKTELGRVAKGKSGRTGRLPVRLRGIWRTRLIALDDVESIRMYQFLVSEWVLRNAQGLDTSFGEPPRR